MRGEGSLASPEMPLLDFGLGASSESGGSTVTIGGDSLSPFASASPGGLSSREATDEVSDGTDVDSSMSLSMSISLSSEEVLLLSVLNPRTILGAAGCRQCGGSGNFKESREGDDTSGLGNVLTA